MTPYFYALSATYLILGGIAIWAKVKSHSNKHPGYKFSAIVLSFVIILITIIDLLFMS